MTSSDISLSSMEGGPQPAEAAAGDIFSDDVPQKAGGKPASSCMARLNFCAFVRSLKDDFGGDFMVMLFSSYFGVKGALYTLVGRGQRPFYLTYMKTSAAQYQNYLTFAGTPWAMKSLIGAISDAVPIRGYHKLPYMIAATILGVVAFAFLVVLPFGGEEVGAAAAGSGDGEVGAPVAAAGSGSGSGGDSGSGSGSDASYAVATAFIAPILFFLINLQIATVDLLTEGRYAAMMVAKPETGASLVSWVWGSYFVGALFVSAWMGSVSEHYGAPMLFALGIPFALQVLIPLCLGYLKEKPILAWNRVTPDAEGGAAAQRGCCANVRVEKFQKEWKMYALALLMTLGALFNSVTGLFLDDVALQLKLTGAWCALMVAGSYWALPRAMASATTYMFLTTALYLGIPGAMDAWYTSGPPCVDDGPHFDDEYYMSYTGIVGSISALGGVALFQLVFQNSTFRKAFWMTTVLKVVASVFDYVIVKRWHRPHMSDKVVYMFGDAIIGEIIGQLDFMPGVVLVSKVCPPGYESLVYAMLGGFQNFGLQVSRYGGAYLTDALGVYALPTGDCNWDNLPLLILISHCLLPLLTVPLTFWLLPDAKLTDDVLMKHTDAGDEAGPDGVDGFDVMEDDDDDDLFSSDGDIPMAV